MYKLLLAFNLLVFPLTVVSAQNLTNFSPKQTLEFYLTRLKSSIKENPNILAKDVKKLLLPLFAVGEISKRVLPHHWNNLSNTEKSEFMEIFMEVLLTTYVNNIKKVNSAKIVFKTQSIKDNKTATVYTEVIFEGNKYPFNYKLLNEGNNWLVYDIVIENIGLITNYRNEFSKIIREEGILKLLEKLKQKIRY